MSRWNTYNNDQFFIDVDFQDDLTTVKIVDRITGNHATAHARRFIGDAYDEKIGHKLAMARAIERLARKNQKYWIKQTKPVEY